MPKRNPFEQDLDKNAANYTPLSPLSLIARTAYAYPDLPAVVHGNRRYTWARPTNARGVSPPRCPSRQFAAAIRWR